MDCPEKGKSREYNPNLSAPGCLAPESRSQGHRNMHAQAEKKVTASWTVVTNFVRARRLQELSSQEVPLTWPCCMAVHGRPQD